jgi:hypothetical protein
MVACLYGTKNRRIEPKSLSILSISVRAKRAFFSPETFATQLVYFPTNSFRGLFNKGLAAVVVSIDVKRFNSSQEMNWLVSSEFN